MSEDSTFERLLEPDIQKITKHLRTGGRLSIARDRIPTVGPRLATKINDQIIDWLKSDNFETLAHFLETNSLLVAHSVVYRQFHHLRRLLHMVGEEDLEDGCPPIPSDQKNPLPRGTKEASLKALTLLVNAWVRGILPGYTIHRIRKPGRKGAPPTEDWIREQWLEEFNKMWKELQKLEGLASAPTLPKRDERRRSFVKRVAGLVQALHRATFYSRTGDAFLQEALPNSVVGAIASQAVSKQKQRLSKNKLLYGLIAYYIFGDSKNLTTARRTIERAEEDFPELDLRGHLRKR